LISPHFTYVAYSMLPLDLIRMGGDGRLGEWRVRTTGRGKQRARDGKKADIDQADFIRNGSAKGIMSMSKEDTTALWNAVQDSDLRAFNAVNHKLLNPATALRHIPLRIYIPQPDADSATGSFKVVQGLVTPRLPNRSSPQQESCRAS